MTKFDRGFPLLLIFLVGFALVGLGAAINTVPGPYWLAFFGTLFGSALAALTGYWLIIKKDAFERASDIRLAVEAIASLIDHRNSILAATGGTDDGRETLFLSDADAFPLSQQSKIISSSAELISKRSILAGLIVDELATSLTLNWSPHLLAANVSTTALPLYNARSAQLNNAITTIRQLCRDEIQLCTLALQRLQADPLLR